MLRYLLPISFFAVMLAISCKKTDEREPVTRTGLEGSWIAKEYIADPGNGDLSWLPFTDAEVLSFDSSGKGRIFSNGIEASGHYQTTSDSTMDIEAATTVSGFRYSRRGDTLEISGLCDETCVTRYLRGKRD